MGFFDNVLKAVNKAKDFVEDIQDKANEAYASKPAQAESAEKATFTPEIIQIMTPTGIDARECKTTFFDCDDNNNDLEIDVTMEIDRRFHEFDSGAGEIDVSYVYSPDMTDDNVYADWEVGTPYILMGFEQQHYNILKAYREGKALPTGTTLQKVEGNSRILFKTTLTRSGEKYVAYHFIRGCAGEELLYHFEACYPTDYAGTPLEETILKALDMMALTYKETIV